MQTVGLRTDADLGAFVRRLLHLFENPKHRDELGRAGSGSGWHPRPCRDPRSRPTARKRAR